jgi:hypothetical protein
VEQLQSVSKLIPGAGHAILATDGPGKLTAAMTFGPYGGFHGHYDKLSFVFFGYGQELGVDPGRSASQAYRLPIHDDWYKATTGHNAILVDGKSQKEAGGQLLSYGASPSYTAVAADAGPAFGNVAHRRFLLLAPTYLLVVDELLALDGQEHTFDWLYHNKGSHISCALSGTDDKLGEAPPGYSYLKDLTAYKVGKEEPFEVSFKNEQITTQLTMLGHPGDEVFTATGPLASVEDRAPIVIVRRKGKIVQFITILEPVAQQQQPDVKGLSLMPDNYLSINIIRAKGEDHVSFATESLENFSVSKKSGSGLSLILKADSKK